MSPVDFVVTLQRGAERAATAQAVSYRARLAAADPGYTKGLNRLDAASR